jgi:serine/threonine protein phosphatase Stp1
MTGFRSSAETDPGTRKHNEDAFVNRPDLGVWAVADGAGGHQAGDVASAMIRDALEAIPPELDAGALLSEVRTRLQDVHQTLLTEAAERGAGALLASTAVVLLTRGNHYAALWAGDSRIYLFRNSVLSCITHDHSRVQEMVDAGLLPPEKAETHPQANVITRAVGAGSGPVVVDKVIGDIHPGDCFLLCSDGLSKTLSDAEIAEQLARVLDQSPAEQLLSAALAKGARDNVTAVVVEVTDQPVHSPLGPVSS